MTIANRITMPVVCMVSLRSAYHTLRFGHRIPGETEENLADAVIQNSLPPATRRTAPTARAHQCAITQYIKPAPLQQPAGLQPAI